MRAEHGERDGDRQSEVPGTRRKPGDREIGHRHHQRQRVAARERFLKQQIEYEIREEGGGEDDQRRAARAAASRNRPANRRSAPRPRPATPPTAQRTRSTARRATSRAPCLRPQHLDVAQILGALDRTVRAQYAGRSAADDDQRHEPESDASEQQKRQGQGRSVRAPDRAARRLGASSYSCLAPAPSPQP